MKRILLVDDHSVVRKGLRQILEDEFEDLEIGEAGDAQEALEQVWRQTWDFVCLD
ncbi:response regulator transcription factor, partial [bacterium]|nr:response regulator transcription factor [bacterium]